MNNLIASMKDINFNKWDELLDEYNKDKINFFVQLYKPVDSYSYDDTARVVDNCPHKAIIECIARIFVAFETYSNKYHTFRKNGNSIVSLLEKGKKCTNLTNKYIFSQEIIKCWLIDKSGTRIDLFFFNNPIETLLKLIFSNDFFKEFVGNITDPNESYKNAINIIYHLYPNEVTNYVKSEEIQPFLQSMKRLQSAKFISNKFVEIVEDLVIKQIGLQPIQFDPVDIEKVMLSCGYKPLQYNNSTENDDEIIDVLKVGDLCYLTSPCQYDVTLLFKNNKTITKPMVTSDIEKLYTKLGKELPLFW